MKKLLRLVCFLAILLVFGGFGCAGSRELWESDYAKQIMREATQEGVTQVGELIEARFGIAMPESVRDQITEILVREIDKGMADLLKDAEERAKAAD